VVFDEAFQWDTVAVKEDDVRCLDSSERPVHDDGLAIALILMPKVAQWKLG
jgi:hypothetical protein